MSQLAATAFFDDELFGDWIHPNRNQYPEDVHLYWLKRLRKGWDLPFNHFLVTTVQDPEEGEVVTGMAQWMRKGEGGAGAPGMEEVEKKRGEEVEAELEREGLRNRAADPKMEDCLERGYPFIAHHWKGNVHLSASVFPLLPFFFGGGVSFFAMACTCCELWMLDWRADGWDRQEERMLRSHMARR